MVCRMISQSKMDYDDPAVYEMIKGQFPREVRACTKFMKNLEPILLFEDGRSRNSFTDRSDGLDSKVYRKIKDRESQV